MCKGARDPEAEEGVVSRGVAVYKRNNTPDSPRAPTRSWDRRHAHPDLPWRWRAGSIDGIAPAGSWCAECRA